MTTTSAPNVGADLAALAERFWDGYLEANPLFATMIGDRRFDDRLPDRSPEATDRHAAWFEGVAQAARALPPEALTASEQVTRQMLFDEAAGEAASIRTRVGEWTVDPLGGRPSRCSTSSTGTPSSGPSRARRSSLAGARSGRTSTRSSAT